MIEETITNVIKLMSLYERNNKDAYHNGKTIFIYLVTRIILPGTKSLKSNKLANLLQWYGHLSIKYVVLYFSTPYLLKSVSPFI